VILPEIGHLVGLAGRGVEDAEEAGDDVEGEIGVTGRRGDDVETDDTETDDAE